MNIGICIYVSYQELINFWSRDHACAGNLNTEFIYTPCTAEAFAGFWSGPICSAIQWSALQMQCYTHLDAVLHTFPQKVTV